MSSRKMLLGARIKELRKRAGLSQDQLAEKVGIESKYLSRIEVGKRYPALDTLDNIADALQVGTKDLFDFDHFQEGAATPRGIDQLVQGASADQLRLINKLINAVLK